MDKDKFVYRYYKISINIWVFSYYGNTRTHKLPKGIILNIVGFLYSLITLAFGFLSFNLSALKKSFEALDINSLGGVDITQILSDMDYDDRTRYVFQNLLRKTSEKIDIDDVMLILQIQDIYCERFKKEYTGENIDFIIQSLSKIEIYRINQDEIRDIFDGKRLYEKSLENAEIC